MAVIGGSAGKLLAIFSHAVVGFHTLIFRVRQMLACLRRDSHIEFEKKSTVYYKAKGDCVISFFEFLGDTL